MTKKAGKTKIFISYSLKDRAFVEAFTDTLQEIEDVTILYPSGERVFDENITENLADKLSKMLKESDIVITLLSPESTNNPNVLFEMGMAIALGKKVIPITRRNADLSSIPFNIRDRNVIASNGPKTTAKHLSKYLLNFAGLTKESA